MWRFKTEEEFYKQYGDDWRNCVENTWASSGKMDYLFGQEIKDEYLNSDGMPRIEYGSTIKNYGISPPNEDSDPIWSISMDMLIHESVKILETPGSYYEIY